MEGLYKKQEIEQALKIETPTLNFWKRKGMPVLKKEGKDYFDFAEVQEWITKLQEPIDDLEIGKGYSNQEISTVFGCSGQGGMRRSHLTNTLILFSDHTKGIYEDKTITDKDGNERLLYTGMGQTGDQDINFAQNKTLNKSNDLSIKVYMFEAFKPSEHIFRGEVKLIDKPYVTEQFDRKVWIFPLGFLEDTFTVPVELSDYKDRLQEKKALYLTEKDLYERATQVEQVGKRKATTSVYVRNVHVSAYVKKRANGHCDLCGAPASFKDRNGQPYLECHHVEWLSRGGEDSIDNAVALDPSCHRKMHELDLQADVSKLKEKIFEYKSRSSQKH